jgi:ligand-binding sensor domain-containing protein
MYPILSVMILLLATSAGVAQARAPELTLEQLNHRVFTANDGAPVDIGALAQTPDGTLWVGGRSGLMRFDGIRFVAYPSPGEEPLPSTNVASVYAMPEGGLWIGFRPGGVALLKGGRVTHYPVGQGFPNGTVQQFARDRDGSVWAVARTGLARFDAGRWQTVADESEIGSPYGVLVDRRGTLWVATVDGLYARPPGESALRRIDRRRYFAPRGLVLTAGSDGRVWASAVDALTDVDAAGAAPVVRTTTIRDASGGPIVLDTAGNLWTPDAKGDELFRIGAKELNAALGGRGLRPA